MGAAMIGHEDLVTVDDLLDEVAELVGWRPRTVTPARLDVDADDRGPVRRARRRAARPIRMAMV